LGFRGGLEEILRGFRGGFRRDLDGDLDGDLEGLYDETVVVSTSIHIEDSHVSGVGSLQTAPFEQYPKGLLSMPTRLRVNIRSKHV